MAGRRTRRNTATSTQSTVRSDNPEHGMIVHVNGLETTLNNVANMMANIMEQLDKALPGPSGTRDVPTRQPRQVLRTTSSPILQELHDPEEVERERQAVARCRAEELARNSKLNGDWAKAASQVIGNGNRNPRETVFERISHQKAHVSERLGKNPDKAPQGWDEVQSQVRVPAPQRLGPPVPEAGIFQDLRQQIQEMQRKINRGRVLTTRTNTPLAPEIFAEPYPQGFKMPFVKRYDGESDPQEHINSYVQTVDSKVADWVNHILAGSIRTWDELGLRFLEHFSGNYRPKKHFTHLASVRQMHRESLKNFLIRWRKESREVEGTDNKSRLAMFTAALQDELLHRSYNSSPGYLRRSNGPGREAETREKRHIGLEDEEEDSEPAPHRQKRHHGFFTNGGLVRGFIPGYIATRRVYGPTYGVEHTVSSNYYKYFEMNHVVEAFIVLPGGVDTMEGLFTLISWASEGLHNRPIGLLNIDGYFNNLIKFLDDAVRQNFMSLSQRKLFISSFFVGELLDKLEFAKAFPGPGVSYDEFVNPGRLDLELHL
ncbi:hypothetical protein DM860_016581 [Cuscuta australis]|uniref:cytokinin riboside 5'-monophosphate phosphoribohydrolase n=1 Tax=Cuscuta australis TaxID=267555 RepID=A0A328DMP8_9ASTE|nr:hypothetical protein DM860_016581 [Cuscuta australis]